MNDKDKKGYSVAKETDNDLWTEVVKDILPLEKCHEVNIYKKQTTAKNTKPQNHTYNAITKDTYSNNETPKSNEVDHRTHTRLKRGQMKIDARLDLHGMTQNQAYDALLSFIPRAHASGKRCVLVITGKGDRDRQGLGKGTGILKQKTPDWLIDAPLERYILKVESARSNHGGDGALYVLLRRNRNQ